MLKIERSKIKLKTNQRNKKTNDNNEKNSQKIDGRKNIPGRGGKKP
jgi:hypothetical protein